MEWCVAQPQEHRRHGKAGIALSAGHHQRGCYETGQRRMQHRPRAHAVHQEPGQRLPQPRHHKEHRHQQAELRVAQVELLDEGRKQRWQQQVEKVRGGMRHSHHANGAGVLLPGNRDERGSGSRHGGSRSGRGMLTRRPEDFSAGCPRILRQGRPCRWPGLAVTRFSAPRARKRSRRQPDPPESRPWDRSVPAGSVWPRGSRCVAGWHA